MADLRYGGVPPSRYEPPIKAVLVIAILLVAASIPVGLVLLLWKAVLA